MTRDDVSSFGAATGIASRVREKLAGRLEDFVVGEVGGKLILEGKAKSYHVKQLAQREVMALTSTPILHNRIEVLQDSRA
ncbi:MAG: hypothetical protein U1D30_05255 [Planctomycetota bacterium]